MYTAWSVIAGEQPTAAKWNILGTNDSSFNDGTGIGTNAIVGASLSTSAIKLGYSEYNTSQGGITTTTDLTGTSTVVTVPAGGRSLYIIGSVALLTSTVTTDRAVLSIQEGAAVIQSSYKIFGSALGQTLTVQALFTPTAGSHTYKLTLARDVGTGTLSTNATASAGVFLSVLLI